MYGSFTALFYIYFERIRPCLVFLTTGGSRGSPDGSINTFRGGV